MRRILTATLVGALGLTASACAEVYHGYFGHADRWETRESIPFDSGQITQRLYIGVNNYTGTELVVSPHFGVRNTSPQDRCVILTFDPGSVRTYGVPARLPLHVPRGRTVQVPLEISAQQAAGQWTWPTPTAYSTAATAANCR